MYTNGKRNKIDCSVDTFANHRINKDEYPLFLGLAMLTSIGYFE